MAQTGISAAVASAHSQSTITLTTDQLEDIITQALIRAGNASSSSTLSVLPGKLSSWLLDSACCNHMTPYPSFFSHTSSARHAPNIHTANGSTMLVRSIGTVSTSKLSISDVFHVPQLSYNLLSVGQLAELGYRIILDYYGCVVQDPRTGQELGTGRRIGRLFEISSLRLPATGVSAATSSSPSLSLWHSRLGHASSSRVQQLVSRGLLGPVSKDNFDCVSCQLGKQPALPFQNSTSQQNGRAERKLRHILDTVRALLLSSKVPVPFWGEAVLTAAHAINRIPSPTISNQTPYERLFGSPPHYQHLRSFGSACFVLLQPHEHNKLEPRSRLCCFLGYGETQKGYRCYDPIAHRLRISRHVVFWEHRLFTEVSQFRPFFSLSSLSDIFPEVSPPSLESFPPSPEVSTSIPQTESSDHFSGSSSQETHHSLPESSALAPSEDPAPATTLRRSSRVTTLPSHLRDFHCYTALATLHEPHSYREASSNPLWQAAMTEELDALSRTRTWDLVDLPPEKSVVGCKWVFKIKTRSDGSIERYKARLVAKGFTQEYGIDYEETFAPVARLSSVRTLLAVAASRQWKLFQMDVKNAFLNGDLSEEVYMQPPPGLSHPPDKVCRLRRALYGLKQAPRAWFAKFSSTISRLGFSISSYDSALFLRRTGKGTILLLLYVDDMIITGDDLSGIQELKAFLSQNFEMKDLGHLSYFLGLEITSSDDGFYLTQAKYTSDLLSRAGLTDHKILDTPIEFNARLTPSSGELLPDPTLYRQLVGSLVYLTVTRPDISYAVHQVSQFMFAPRSTHYAAVLRILRYLKGTLFHGLHFSAQSPLTLRAYSDVDWAGDPTDRRSTTGYCFLLGSSLISWRSKKQSVVARSSTEAEYRALADTTSELLWLRWLLQDLGVSTSSATPIYCDNRSAIQIARNDVFHERTKHIEIDCHLVRHHLLQGSLQLISVSSHDQLADIFTKSHPTGPEAQQQQSIVSPDSSLTPTSTNSSWPSPSGLYAFGFYKQGNGYSVGIFLAGIPQKTIVWTANRDNPPVPADVTLNFTSDGRLVLQSTQGTVTIVDGGATSASMLYTGNFVVYNSKNKSIWESFQHPIDTLLPNQQLSSSANVQGVLDSSVSESNQSTGIFRTLMQQDGFLALYPLGTPYTREYGYWSSEGNVTGAQNNANLNLGVDGHLYLANGNNTVTISTVKNSTKGVLYLLRMDADGFLRLYSHTMDGIMGMVLVKDGFRCNYLPGFVHLDNNKAFAGCTRNFTVEICKEKYQTYPTEAIANITWENQTDYVPLLTSAQIDCQNACSQDCNCEAVLFQDGACSKQRLPLRFGQRTEGNSNVALIKVLTFTPATESNCAKRQKERELERVTDNFKEELGRGSFGIVYKGAIENGEKVVASCQKIREIVGFWCMKYMSNGSLGDILFKPRNKPCWDKRMEIACNVAKGILYLHEDCMPQIIHCDIKPQNILMDENMCAKISDFGLAKLLKPDQSRTSTDIRGTRGYVAPEWHRKASVTVKVDVYSFGIVLLEIICCRKSVDCNLPEKEAILEELVYNCFECGELSNLVNDEDVDKTQLERMVKVALWCILDQPSLRPSMKKVLLMLEGTMDIPSPSQSYFYS
uniref:Protein kinase domain-containing protein n=1 Tax=Fagus sylvatica TaxID=28930 RepID=A0A2N9EWS2_FAGSY